VRNDPSRRSRLPRSAPHVYIAPMRFLPLFVILALLGCGGSSSSSESSSSGSSGSETAARPAWDDMTPEQRGQFMAEVVVPEMRTIFQEHDATRFADFGCATCHGANAHDVHFQMPNGVHPLDHATIMATFQSQDPSATWMTQRVWPRMAELIGEAPFNPETGEGFRCVNCHADGEPAAAAPSGS
jgi:hypothetical protein